MTLLSFLECVVGSAWIEKGKESVELLDRNISNGVGGDEELSVSIKLQVIQLSS